MNQIIEATAVLVARETSGNTSMTDSSATIPSDLCHANRDFVQSSIWSSLSIEKSLPYICNAGATVLHEVYSRDPNVGNVSGLPPDLG